MIIKVIGIAFVGLICFNLLKNVKPEFSLAAVIATGAIIVILLSERIVDAVKAFGDLTEKSGLKNETFSAIIKIIGIGYLTEYSSSICEDAGSKSLAQKIQLGGKITVLILAMPIILNIFDIIEGIL